MTTTPAPADRPADLLRAAVADAIAAVDSGSWGTETASMHPYWRDVYLRYADAALAVTRHVLGTVTAPPETEAAPTPMPAEPLKPTEREFLTYALDLAADKMASVNGFTDEDEAALDRLRRLADEAQQPTGAVTTADKAAALGMEPTDYRRYSHDAAVEQVREAARGLYAETGQRVMDALEQPAPAVTKEATP